MKAFIQAAALAALLSGSASAAFAADPALQGRWDAVLTRNGQEIPFRLDLKGEGNDLQAIFYDGKRPYDGSTSASFKDGKLLVNVDHYLTTINAKVEGDALVGDVQTQGRESSAAYGFKAVRHVQKAQPVAAQNVPSIAGNYLIPLDAPSSKGEKAFRFVVDQEGAEVSASILRIDGDTGAYTGEFKDGKWVLSHFDGGRPGVITVVPKADGSLQIIQNGGRAAAATAASNNEYGPAAVADGRNANVLTAYKPDVYKAKGLPAPADFLTHTTIRDKNEKFTFNFPDEHGKLISQDDPRFKDKVVLAIVTGTWCPNCHDEAQYLVELDKKYRDKGLAIVALSFEEPEQQGHLKRAKAFIKQYGVKYTYLYPGAPAEMWEKVPQLNHLDTWPATLFIGRDGKIDAVHSGFASPAAGDYHAQLKKDFDERIERLLAQKAGTTVAETAAPTKLAQSK